MTLKPKMENISNNIIFPTKQMINESSNMSPRTNEGKTGIIKKLLNFASWPLKSREIVLDADDVLEIDRSIFMLKMQTSDLRNDFERSFKDFMVEFSALRKLTVDTFKQIKSPSKSLKSINSLRK